MHTKGGQLGQFQCFSKDSLGGAPYHFNLPTLLVNNHSSCLLVGIDMMNGFIHSNECMLKQANTYMIYVHVGVIMMHT